MTIIPCIKYSWKTQFLIDTLTCQRVLLLLVQMEQQGPDLPCSLKAGNRQNKQNESFQHRGHRAMTLMTPGRQETKGALWTPSLIPWNQAVQGKERQRSPVNSVLRAAEDQGESSLQDRAPEGRTAQRKLRRTAKDAHRAFNEVWSVHTRKEVTWGWGSGKRQQCQGLTQGRKEYLFSQGRLENLRVHKAMGRVWPCLSNGEELSLDYPLLWPHLKNQDPRGSNYFPVT